MLEPRSDDAARLRELGGRPSSVELAERVRRRAARLVIRGIPRGHNQVAHALARGAMAETAGGPTR